MDETEIEIPEIKEEEKQGKKFGAKVLSKLSMIMGVLWIMGMTLLKAFKIVELDTKDIIYTAVAIVGVWSPTYLSIILDKVYNIKTGSQE